MNWIRLRTLCPVALVLVVMFALVAPAAALDYVTLRRNGVEQTVSGRIVVTITDGGVLLQSRDGMLWSIPKDEQVSKTKDDEPFVPLTAAALGQQLLKELPPGFEVYATQNYLILHNTSKPYAQWCGALLEQLQKAFTNYWSRRDFDLKKPEFPMVALVFADKNSYARFTRAELGDAADAIIGYYSLQTNRITMYDLTGLESRSTDKRTTTAQINAMLTRPEAERAVATVIHEATHQVALNTGLEARYADIPLWVSEGVAIYFETPDLKSAKGWGNIGGVNHVRLAGLREYSRRRGSDSLQSLIVDDTRFRDTSTGPQAYAEAWALNYFLIRQRPKQYLEYTRLLATKQPLVVDTPETRLREFCQCFGDDLKQLDIEFMRYMATVK